MKLVNASLKNMCGLLLILSMISPGYAFADSINEIFDWVAKELKIKNQYPVPEIEIVSKGDLSAILLEKIEESYDAMTREMGEEEANRLVQTYLEEVLGLYVPSTKWIYVRDDMEPCKRNSIIAHEITHYFQTEDRGILDWENPLENERRFFREMEASKIENRFFNTFCHVDEQ